MFYYHYITRPLGFLRLWKVLCCYAAICRKIPIDRLCIVSYVPPTVQSLQPLSMQDGDEKHQNENENQFGIKDDGYLRERLHFICWEYPLIGHITALKPVMCNSNCIVMDLHDVRNGNYHLSAAAARKKKCWKNWRGLIRGTGLKPRAKTGKQTTKCNPLSLSLDQHQQTLEFYNFDNDHHRCISFTQYSEKTPTSTFLPLTSIPTAHV